MRRRAASSRLGWGEHLSGPRQLVALRARLTCLMCGYGCPISGINHQVMSGLLQRGSSILIATLLQRGLTVNSFDHKECNFPHHLSLWRRRSHDERCSANGWRLIARKERRHLSVKTTHEEGSAVDSNPQPTKLADLHDLCVFWHPLPRSKSLRLPSLCPMKYKIP